MPEKMSAEELERIDRDIGVLPKRMCRDCADRDGVCDDGTPCDPRFVSNETARKLRAHIATLQREADGMREALQYITRWLMTDVDALPPHVTRDDVRIYHLDGAILHNCLERARAALNGSPQARAEGDSNA